MVFRSHMEHHSNDITWRETIAETVYVDFDAHGRVSLEHLDLLLAAYADRPLKIGTFSAASNVTGILNDTTAIARVLHAHGALAFFDYAASGPYVDIDLHPRGRRTAAPDEAAAKDAAFFSMHKFLGGPRTPGPAGREPAAVHEPRALGARRRHGALHLAHRARLPARLLPPRDRRHAAHRGQHPGRARASTSSTRSAPSACGASSRTTCGARWPSGRGTRASRCWATWSPSGWRWSRSSSTGVHHNLASALLNDFFGIQVRGGCMCAGPYGHELLHIDQGVSLAIKHQLEEGHIGVKPGWVRICFSPVTGEKEFQTLLEGVDFVSKRGRDFYDRYTLDDHTGEWRRTGAAPAPRG